MQYIGRVIAILFLLVYGTRQCQADFIGVLVPAYSNPAFSTDGPTMWNSLVDTAERSDRNFAIRAILNPDTGPGSTASLQQERFKQFFGETGGGLASQFRTAGGTILGYVSTLRGERTLAEVTADIDVYMSGVYSSNIDGIFLDDFFDAASDIPYYQSVFNHIQTNYGNLPIVGNTGNVGDTFSGLNSLTVAQAADLIGPLDTLISHEMSSSAYADNYSDLVHAAQYPDSKFAHLIHDAGTWDSDLLEQAKARGAGWFYATPDAGANPWDNFNPEFWSSFTNSVNAVPEPGSAGLVFVAAALLLRRRRVPKNRHGT